MKTTFKIEYKLVSKFGLDRGEVGGFGASRILNTLEEVASFYRSYRMADSYRYYSYGEKDSLPDDTLFFYGPIKVTRRDLVFDKKDYVKGMRCPKIGPFQRFEVDGKYLKWREHPYAKTAGYFCYSHKDSSLQEAWEVLKHKNTGKAQIWGCTDIKEYELQNPSNERK